jgi:hypothetical protein
LTPHVRIRRGNRPDERHHSIKEETMRKRAFAVAAIIATVSLGAGLTFNGPEALAAQSSQNGRKLVGTWDVVFRFPVCDQVCTCPGGVPNIPVPATQTYHGDSTMIEVGGGLLFRSAALGRWQHLSGHRFASTFRAFLFFPDGTRRGIQLARSEIYLYDNDTFEAAAASQQFLADGTPIPGAEACPIHVSGTRMQ